MTERRLIHIGRNAKGELVATARHVSPEARASWEREGFTIYAVEVEIPVEASGEVLKGVVTGG